MSVATRVFIDTEMSDILYKVTRYDSHDMIHVMEYYCNLASKSSCLLCHVSLLWHSLIFFKVVPLSK